MSSKKIFFAADFHLGVPNPSESREREKKIVRWLESIQHEADEIFLLGDVFDFWFEYKRAVPKGFVRLQGKIAELTDANVPIHWFAGNHDMWIFDYLPEELGITLHRSPIEREFNGKKFLIGHGDGLGPGDYGYKCIKKLFGNRFCQWLFARLHPNFGIALANLSSHTSRATTEKNERAFYGEEGEMLIQFCQSQLLKRHYDYFIFGHRHLPIYYPLSQQSVYLNLGDWIRDFSYAVFDSHKITLTHFEKKGSFPLFY